MQPVELKIALSAERTLRYEAEIGSGAMGNEFGNMIGQQRVVVQGSQPIRFVRQQTIHCFSRARLHDIQRLCRFVQQENRVLIPGARSTGATTGETRFIPYRISDQRQFFRFNTTHCTQETWQSCHGAHWNPELARLEELPTFFLRCAFTWNCETHTAFPAQCKVSPSEPIISSVQAAYFIHDCPLIRSMTD
jgi:hypothetical protein